MSNDNGFTTLYREQLLRFQEDVLSNSMGARDVNDQARQLIRNVQIEEESIGIEMMQGVDVAQAAAAAVDH